MHRRSHLCRRPGRAIRRCRTTSIRRHRCCCHRRTVHSSRHLQRQPFTAELAEATKVEHHVARRRHVVISQSVGAVNQGQCLRIGTRRMMSKSRISAGLNRRVTWLERRRPGSLKSSDVSRSPVAGARPSNLPMLVNTPSSQASPGSTVPSPQISCRCSPDRQLRRRCRRYRRRHTSAHVQTVPSPQRALMVHVVCRQRSGTVSAVEDCRCRILRSLSRMPSPQVANWHRAER